MLKLTITTFRSEDEADHQYEFSVPSMRIRFGSRDFSKCACSERITRTGSCPRPPIKRSVRRLNSKTSYATAILHADSEPAKQYTCRFFLRLITRRPTTKY